MADWLGREDHLDSPFLRDPVTGKMKLRYDELRFKRHENVNGSYRYSVELHYKGKLLHTYTTEDMLGSLGQAESVNLPGLTGLVDILSTS